MFEGFDACKLMSLDENETNMMLKYPHCIPLFTVTWGSNERWCQDSRGHRTVLRQWSHHKKEKNREGKRENEPAPLRMKEILNGKGEMALFRCVWCAEHTAIRSVRSCLNTQVPAEDDIL